MFELLVNLSLMKKEEFRFSIGVPVRYSDVDSRGHVNNAAYITYFEEGRARYLTELLDLHEVDSFGIIVLDVHCFYKSPAYYGETLKVFAKVTWLGDKSFEMAYLVTDTASGRKVAEGSGVLVGYDYSVRKTATIPDAYREKIAAYEGIPKRKDR